MTRYEPIALFSVAAFHSYFANGICTVLSFKPGDNTKVLQKRYAFPLSETKNGFIFYGAGNGSAVAMLQYVMDTTGISFFDFTITTERSDFYNYTELPVAWKGRLEYESTDVTAEGNNTFLLKQHLSPVESSAVAGTLRIQFADIIALLEKGITPSYEIRLTARSTQWQYYFINDSGIPFNDPAITNDQGYQFIGPEQVTIPNGTKAQLFSSGNQKLALNERPAYRFSLINRNERQTGRNKTIIKQLPCADPEEFSLAQSGNELQYSSPIYVFI